jgi:hypothetical protein
MIGVGSAYAGSVSKFPICVIEASTRKTDFCERSDAGIAYAHLPFIFYKKGKACLLCLSAFPPFRPFNNR